jgi:murein DD-endopeptidase MepM/ murein hydrolase activator NlpD
MIDAATAFADLTPVPDAPDKASSPEEVGKQAEAMFARLLMKEVRKAMPEDGLLGGKAAAMWQDLFDEAVADQIAEGGHLGLADQITEMLGGAPRSQVHVPDLRAMPRRHANPDVHGTPTEGRITSRFGHRSDPFHGRQKFHSGLDIGAPKGTPFRAMRAGTVTFAGDRGSYGKLVVVDHGDGVETRYAHADGIEVQVGQQVGQGEALGTVGASGRATGPHLHFEVRRNGRPLDPAPFLRRNPVADTSTEDHPQSHPEPSR